MTRSDWECQMVHLEVYRKKTEFQKADRRKYEYAYQLHPFVQLFRKLFVGCFHITYQGHYTIIKDFEPMITQTTSGGHYIKIKDLELENMKGKKDFIISKLILGNNEVPCKVYFPEGNVLNMIPHILLAPSALHYELVTQDSKRSQNRQYVSNFDQNTKYQTDVDILNLLLKIV